MSEGSAVRERGRWRAAGARVVGSLPAWTRSLRFRLALLWSGLLLVVVGLVVGGIYLALARTVGSSPITETFKAVEGVRRRDGSFKALREIEVAEVSDIERAVNAQTLQSLRDYALWALVGLFVASLLIGWLLAGRALRPLRRITATAEQVKAGDLSRRVALGRDDELGTLASSIDAMLARLDDAFSTQRKLVDDASHELRTPLAVIRTNVDAVLSRADAPEQERQRAVAVVDRAVERMTRLVEDLLASARSASRVGVEASVPVADVAWEAVEEAQPLADERAVSLALLVHQPVTADVDRDLLRRAIGNLLANAARLAPAGSTVVTAVGQLDGWAYVAVRDEGPGIPVEDQPKVFDRFWRGPGARTDGHVGLGLSIAAQSVEAHGGVVRLHSEVGVGSSFVIWLPTETAAPGSTPASIDPLERATTPTSPGQDIRTRPSTP